MLQANFLMVLLPKVISFESDTTQLVFTCSKSIMETPEQYVKTAKG